MCNEVQDRNAGFLEKATEETVDYRKKVREDLDCIQADFKQLEEDLGNLKDQEKEDLREEIKERLSEYAEEISYLKTLDETLVSKLGRHGRTFLYICIGILAIAGLDKFLLG